MENKQNNTKNAQSPNKSQNEMPPIKAGSPAHGPLQDKDTASTTGKPENKTGQKPSTNPSATPGQNNGEAKRAS